MHNADDPAEECARYTLAQLRDAARHVNRAKYPERAALLDSWLARREAESAESERSVPPERQPSVSSVLADICAGIGLGALAAFMVGFFVPLLLAPDSGNGPLAGFLFAPFGGAIGGVGGFVAGFTTSDDGRRKVLLGVTATVAILAVLLILTSK